MAIMMALLSGVTISLLVMGVASQLIARAKAAKRIARIVKGLGATRYLDAQVSAPFRSRLWKAVQRSLNVIKLVRGDDAKRTQARLHRAGIRAPNAIGAYGLFKLLLPIFAGGLSLVAQLIAASDRGWPMIATLVLLAALAFSYAPDIYIRLHTARRDARILESFPEALDIMVVCAEAGLSIDVTIQRTAREIRISSRALAAELMWLVNAFRFRPDRRAALEDFAARLDLPAIHTFANTVIQTERYGTPIAEALRALTAELRRERLLRAEERAARLGATLTIPLVLFIMPALFVLLIGPAAIRALEMISR